MSLNPLEHGWCFWEHRKSSGTSNENYGSNMYNLGVFKTVNEFWGYFKNIPAPSKLFFTDDIGVKKLSDRDINGFAMFKNGIKPAWEDKENTNGGEIRIMVTDYKLLDSIWEDLVLATIGETIDPYNEICGIRVVDKTRKNVACYSFEIWYKVSPDEKEYIDVLKENVKSIINIDTDRFKMSERSHATVINELHTRKR